MFYNLSPVVHQFYETRVQDEFVLKGNSVVLKCAIPSFVSDFIEVYSWLDSDGAEYLKDLVERGNRMCLWSPKQKIILMPPPKGQNTLL
uniref:Ig-like domain-containing protein n=1 Tax=Megaselia scalaris TaxID=36166 RepID=T1GRB6_MEGSC